MNPPPFAEFDQCICFNLRWVTRLVTQHYDHALSECGLRATQLPILARLAAGPMTTADLADWLAMDRTTLVRNLRPLQRANYIARTPGTAGRSLELRLTPAGSSLLAKAHPLWREAQDEMTRTLGGERWKTLLADLSSAGEGLASGNN